MKAFLLALLTATGLCCCTGRSSYPQELKDAIRDTPEIDGPGMHWPPR